MRNHLKISPAMAADRRLDVLKKQQENEHMHLIACHNKEMQDMRELLNFVLQKCEAICERNDKEVSELKNRTEVHIEHLRQRVVDHEIELLDKTEAIKSLYEQLQAIKENKVSKKDLDAFQRDNQNTIHDSIKTNISCFQDLQREMKSMLSLLRTDLENSECTLKNAIEDAIIRGEANFTLAKLDKEGIERELIRYKKAVFYIEKKIENIYTLIERMKARV